MDDIEQIIAKGIINSRLGVVVTDSKRDIIKVNERFSELFGYDEKDVLGKNCSLLQGPKTDVKDVLALRNSLNKLESHETILLNYNSNGKEIWNKVQITPLIHNEELFYVGTQSDVTEKFNKLLESTKGTNIMIHDIKNTFANIAGFIDLIKMEEDNPNINEYLDYMDTTIIEGIKTLENNLLSELYSSGNFKPNYEKLDISELLTRTANFYSLKHKNNGIKFSSNIEPEVVKFADKRIINTIVTNYINNSEKHTASGEISLNLEKQEDKYIISVKDTGKGIKEEDKPYIFNKDFTTSGYGIGLHTCKKLAEIVNGELSFESEYNRGSTFYAEFKDLKKNLS